MLGNEVTASWDRVNFRLLVTPGQCRLGLFRNAHGPLSIGTEEHIPEIALVICGKTRLGYGQRRHQRLKFAGGVILRQILGLTAFARSRAFMTCYAG
jgi:hypothetical protein